MYAWPFPFPSWIAPGHQSAHDALAPTKSVLSELPLSIKWVIRAWQLPSGEFGKPRKLQPQPGSQLQNSR